MLPMRIERRTKVPITEVLFVDVAFLDIFNSHPSIGLAIIILRLDFYFQSFFLFWDAIAYLEDVFRDPARREMEGVQLLVVDRGVDVASCVSLIVEVLVIREYLLPI